MSELETTGTQEMTQNEATTVSQESNGPQDENAEIARLKAELAKAKAATDKATKEAGDFRKQLRARQTAEEAQAEAEKERQEAIEKELNELRKERAVAVMSKKAFTFVQDENAATSIAEALYGAEDVDLALETIQKAWVAKEKALRLEFGKVPAPGIGNSDGPTISKAQLDAMGYKDRLEFANKHPDEYKKLMGR